MVAPHVCPGQFGGKGESMGEAMIRLEAVTKQYDGTTSPAVTGLSLDVPEGEIAVLVGPSGCGKTTTLKMINRLIEPTAGHIVVAGARVGDMEAHELRRGIGYVIQQIGLFPHRTIAQNIATVPKLLGWPRARIEERVDELIEVVHLEAELRDRYPAELSGGQRQRVGVARALAADPPVMLMDEPFGAVDPIIRSALQGQFLELQREVNKTVVLVTHDIDEAIRLGDRVAILNVGGVLEQYGRPEDVLREPANEFVAEFLGRDRGLKRLGLIPIHAVDLEPGPSLPPGATPEDARQVMAHHGVDWIAVVDGTRLLGWAPDTALVGAATLGDVALRTFRAVISHDASLKEALDAVISSRSRAAAVLDGDEFLGMLTAETIGREIVQ
jgi:osmoprotectant transport system ATP-binding protein